MWRDGEQPAPYRHHTVVGFRVHHARHDGPLVGDVIVHLARVQLNIRSAAPYPAAANRNFSLLNGAGRRISRFRHRRDLRHPQVVFRVVLDAGMKMVVRAIPSISLKFISNVHL